MKTLFLVCALALPAFNKLEDYGLLVTYIEARYPKYEVVFINQDEKLLNPGAEKSPLSTVPEGLRIWLIRRSA